MFLLGDKLLVEVVERLRHFSQPFGLLDHQGREEMFLDFRKGLWIVLGLVRELFRIFLFEPVILKKQLNPPDVETSVNVSRFMLWESPC